MSKKVLAIYYSQSGQLAGIIHSFCAPLVQAGISVETVVIEPATAYPFPWTADSFFSVMPDAVLGVPVPLVPFTLKEKSYDLVVLGYQAWFLSPSIPLNALFRDPVFRQVIRQTPVITITGARNMWVNAFKGVKKLLADADAKLVANIALADRHLNLVSIFTIFHWMLSGKKSKWLNIFPLPGVSAADIAGTATFGTIVLPFLQAGRWSGLQSALVASHAVALKYHLMFIESKAGIMFKLWAKAIAKRKNKAAWLRAFKYYLFIALFLLAPLVYIIDLIFFKLFLTSYTKAQKQQLLTFE